MSVWTLREMRASPGRYILNNIDGSLYTNAAEIRAHAYDTSSSQGAYSNEPAHPNKAYERLMVPNTPLLAYMLAPPYNIASASRGLINTVAITMLRHS